MKLKDARELYYFYSGKTSDVVRQLGLAGIAIIWIFKRDVNGIPKISAELVPALWLIALGLGFDLLQYAVSTLTWGIYQRRQELKKVREDTDFRAPRWFNWPGIFFITSKVLLIAIAYIFIIRFLVTIIF